MSGAAAVEPRDVRLKRLRLRSWRRGTREMDLLLGPYADAALAEAGDAALDAYEALLVEEDPDLCAWLVGARSAPARHGALVARIRAFHGIG